MSTHKHKLTEINKENKTAVCSICGPTSINVKKCGGTICKTSVQETNSKRRTRVDLGNGFHGMKCARYGVTLEQVKACYEIQEGKCGICKTNLGNRYRIDHNHETKAFRGLLCHRCNTGLGHFKDSVENINRAIAYVGRFR